MHLRAIFLSKEIHCADLPQAQYSLTALAQTRLWPRTAETDGTISIVSKTLILILILGISISIGIDWGLF